MAPRNRVLGCPEGQHLAVVTRHLRQPTGKAKLTADYRAGTQRPKGVILVSEAFTEINAGLVIVLASGHEHPIPISTLTEPDMDPDEVAHTLVRAYHEHEAYLATTYPPTVASGLLGSPLLGPGR